jgi:pimeloyl-ACP methyl ester carboxylesterase
MTALCLRTCRHFTVADEMMALQKVPQACGAHAASAIVRRAADCHQSGIARPNNKTATQPEWLAARRRLLSLSSNASHIVVEASGHMIQFSEPKVIVEEMRRLWREAR